MRLYRRKWREKWLHEIPRCSCLPNFCLHRADDYDDDQDTKSYAAMGKSRGKHAVIKPRRLSMRSSSDTDSSGGSGIGGGSMTFNSNSNSIGRSDGDSSCHGDGGKNTYENELLLSLEESVDWHNQTSGFVSSYNVPLANDVESTPVTSNSISAGSTADNTVKRHHTRRGSTHMQNNMPQDQFNYSFKRSTSSGSPVSNYDGIQQPKLALQRQMSDNNLKDIFRPPSRSPSSSPRAARARSNSSDQHLPSLGLIMADAAAASENTNNTVLGGGTRRSPIPIGLPPPLPPVNKFNYSSVDVSFNTTILPGNGDDQDGINQTKDAQVKSSRTSPLRGIHIPTTAAAAIEFDSDIKRAINTKIKRKSKPKIKKNNLVIQHAAPVSVGGNTKGGVRIAHHPPQQKQIQQQRLCKPRSPPTMMSALPPTMMSPLPSGMLPPSPMTTPSPSSRLLLPPTHPFSQIQPTPSNDSTSPLRTNRHARANSVTSLMSDYSSAAESEATPQVRGGRRGGQSCGDFARLASSEAELVNKEVIGRQGQEPYNKPTMTFSFSDDEEDDDFNNNNNIISPSQERLSTTSTTELRGIDISFTMLDEATASADGKMISKSLMVSHVPTNAATTTIPELNYNANHNNTHSILTSILPANNAYMNHPQQQYNNDDPVETSSLDDSTSHVSQFSSDDRFFEGIHNSGLQSLSFEQVADTDLNTCMDVEIEMVYNSGSMSFDTADNNSVVSEDDMIESSAQDSLEKRREMEKRILQWRRGRYAWMKNSEESLGNHNRYPPPAQRQRQLAIATENDDDIEMAPLVLGHTSNSNGFMGRGKQFQQLLSPSADTPRKVNSFSSISLTAEADDDGEDDDDEDEFTGLTSTAIRKQYSKHNDDPAFYCNCIYYCCHCISFICQQLYCCKNRNYRSSRNWQISGWRKLLFVSSCFFLLAWVVTHGKLEKHHNESYSNVNENDDPLARDKLVDDFYVVSESTNTEDEAADWKDMSQNYGVHETTATVSAASNNVQPTYDPLAKDNFSENSRIIDEDDNIASPDESTNQDDAVDWQSSSQTSANNQQLQSASTQELSSIADIDTIVVLGGCELFSSPSVDWLVDKLKRLFPELNILDGFAVQFDDSAKPTHRKLPFISSHSLLRSSHRSAEVLTPPPVVVNDEENITIEQNIMLSQKDEAPQEVLKSARAIVVAVFFNPYEWVEFMRVNAHEELYINDTLEWTEFVEFELPSINGTILDLRADCIQSAIVKSAEREGVELVIPVRYEDLVEPYNNTSNYANNATFQLPGIVGVLEQIQNRTGLRPDQSAGWMKSTKENNDFWAVPAGCTRDSCFASLHNISHDVPYIRYMNEHVDWSAEKLVGYQQWPIPTFEIDQIVVLGERHSGAEWLVERLARCFPTVQVRYGFSRPGKWFQSLPGSIPQTLLISVFLNPHDWVELMRQNPINAPAHKDMEWSEFVLSSWERERSDQDKSLSDTTHANCSYGFYFEEVIPCMTQRDPQSDSFPLYELHPVTSGAFAGDPYSNILELRADKIRNFLGAATFEGVVDSIIVHYEDLVWDEDYRHLSKPYPGISGLLEEIDDRTNLIPDESAGWVNDDEDYFKASALGVGTMKLDPYFVHWMDEHVDWDVELLVGYSP